MQDKLFRWLVRLLPEDFRAGYGLDIEATFRAERREARRQRSWTAMARLWVTTVVDLLRLAPAEHLDVLGRDLRFAIRTIRGRPLHALAAVVTLALGIGANVAMFAVVDTVLIAPLPYRDPSALVSVSQTENGLGQSKLGYQTFLDLRERSRSFESLVAVSASTATLTGGDLDPERVNAMRVSRAYFEMLGVAPTLGRSFTDQEDQPGEARRVVVLADSLWRRRFAADPSTVGDTIAISGTEYRVIGVLPPGFEDLVAARMYRGAELWYPLGYDPAASFACRTCRHLRVFGRLAENADLEATRSELDQIFGTLEGEHPSEYHAAGAQVTRLVDVFLGPVRPVLLVLWAGVVVLLLVACGNVTNLLLLRAGEREHEIAVRAALGVTAGRLGRQLVTESLLLGAVGGAAGLGVAWAAVGLLRRAGPAAIPRILDATIDARVVAMALLLAIVSAMLFGLVPLRHLLRRTVGRELRGAGKQTESAAVWRVRRRIVTANVAMAALLLVGSGLLVRSLNGLLAVAPGFDPSGVLTMKIWATGAAFREGETADQVGTAVRFYDEVLSRVRSLPGVTAAAAVTTLPLGGGVDGYGFHIEGRPSANPEAAPSADRFVVTPDYFATLHIPLVRGRQLDERDRQDREAVVAINRTAAEELFPGEDPIGQQVSLGPPSAMPRTIVGVVGDVRHHGLSVPVGYQVYVPQAQWAWAETFMTLVIRSTDAATQARPVRDVVRTIDPEQPVTDIALYDDIVAASTGARSLAATLLTAFAATALILAMVGLYGALGVMVGQWRHQIGLRIALGASASEIRRLVLGQGLRPVAVGLALGLGLAALSVRGLRSMLYDVEALDPVSFALAALVLAGCAAVACLLPAWRASCTDPVVVLRSD